MEQPRQKPDRRPPIWKPAVSFLYREQEATNSAQLGSARRVLICYTLSQQAGQMSVHFEWDKRKAEANLRKHGISFDEASTVFDDPLAAIFDDDDHSINEMREIIIGHSINNRLLIVFFTERVKDAIRIISARLATRKERNDYEENINR